MPTSFDQGLFFARDKQQKSRRHLVVCATAVACNVLCQAIRQQAHSENRQ